MKSVDLGLWSRSALEFLKAEEWSYAGPYTMCPTCHGIKPDSDHARCVLNPHSYHKLSDEHVPTVPEYAKKSIGHTSDCERARLIRELEGE